jgi:hypothetical protein
MRLKADMPLGCSQVACTPFADITIVAKFLMQGRQYSAKFVTSAANLPPLILRGHYLPKLRCKCQSLAIDLCDKDCRQSAKPIITESMLLRASILAPER